MPRETTLKGVGVLNVPVVIAPLQAVKGVSFKVSCILSIFL